VTKYISFATPVPFFYESVKTKKTKKNCGRTKVNIKDKPMNKETYTNRQVAITNQPSTKYWVDE
jgi:hypothetical protein